MKISIIILNFNNLRDTKECFLSLQKIKKNKKIDIEVVIVDNASEEAVNFSKTLSEALSLSKNLKFFIIKNQKNLGYAQGCNFGISYALREKADYIMLLNNDTLVEEYFLLELLDLFQKNKNLGIVSPKIYFAPGYEYHKVKYPKSNRGKVIWYAGGLMDQNNVLASHRGVDEIDQGQYDFDSETDFATGCCMLIKNEVFNKIGLLNPKYFLYLEDLDFCMRAKKAGYKIYYASKAKIWHKNASSSGGAGGETSIYYQTRNRLLFSLKYAGLRSKYSVFKEAIGKLIRGSKTEKEAIRDFFLLKLGKKSD